MKSQVTILILYHTHTVVCDDSEFQCGNGACIPSVWTCDYFNDCGDNSDEEVGVCVCNPSFEFQCKSGGCVKATWACDGEQDCFDGSDESAVLCGYTTTEVAATTSVRPSGIVYLAVTARLQLVMVHKDIVSIEYDDCSHLKTLIDNDCPGKIHIIDVYKMIVQNCPENSWCALNSSSNT